MRLNRKALMGTVAAVALGGAMGVSSAAQAFDNVNWTWNQTITEDITKTVRINISINPIGMIDDQIVQIQIGDVSAESHVSGVYNWKPLEQVEYKTGYKAKHAIDVEGGYHYKKGGFGKEFSQTTNTVSNTNSFDAHLNGELTTNGTGVPFFIGGAGVIGGFFTSPGPDGAAGAGVIGAIGAYATDGHAEFQSGLDGHLTTTNSTTTTLDERYAYFHAGFGEFGGNLTVNTQEIYTIYALAPALQDATKELPKVESNATAVGNLISIETDVAVQEHSLQIVADTNCNHVDNGATGTQQGCNPDFNEAQFDLDADLNVNDRFVNVDSGNYNHDVGLLATLAAGAGLLKKADISAVSTVDDILNASVDSTATAIGNLKTIDVNTALPTNGLVIADITQVSVADVSAYSTVGDPLLGPVSLTEQSYGGGIHFVNYNKLGGVTLAKSTATAIGNVVNIGVNSGQGNAP